MPMGNPPAPWTKTFDVLDAFPADEPLTSKDIADRVDWALDGDGSAVSGFLSDLVDRGFIERTEQTRLTHYRITSTGIIACETARPEEDV